jgi:hypothetical protein
MTAAEWAANAYQHWAKGETGQADLAAVIHQAMAQTEQETRRLAGAHVEGLMGKFKTDDPAQQVLAAAAETIRSGTYRREPAAPTATVPAGT